MRRRAVLKGGFCIVLGLAGATGSGVQAKSAGRTAWVITRDGRSLEGALNLESLTLTVNGAARKIPLRDVRSFHSAMPASEAEAPRAV